MQKDIGFTFDAEPVKVEYAQITAVVQCSGLESLASDTDGKYTDLRNVQTQYCQ
ncbi:MAG: hypothetical protein LBJ41_04525 [Treponema sp.]|nr:hypothetical protein [Treponema sp.]